MRPHWTGLAHPPPALQQAALGLAALGAVTWLTDLACANCNYL